jgi:phage terminase Nu1 subunit (DNA packaging protein)
MDPDKLDPFQRKAHYQAEHEALKLQTERAELVPRIEVEQEMARIAKIIAQCFDTLPDRLERDCGMQPVAVAKVERCLDEVREELHRAVIEDEDARSAHV